MMTNNSLMNDIEHGPDQGRIGHGQQHHESFDAVNMQETSEHGLTRRISVKEMDLRNLDASLFEVREVNSGTNQLRSTTQNPLPPSLPASPSHSPPRNQVTQDNTQEIRLKRRLSVEGMDLSTLNSNLAQVTDLFPTKLATAERVLAPPLNILEIHSTGKRVERNMTTKELFYFIMSSMSSMPEVESNGNEAEIPRPSLPPSPFQHRVVALDQKRSRSHNNLQSLQNKREQNRAVPLSSVDSTNSSLPQSTSTSKLKTEERGRLKPQQQLQLQHQHQLGQSRQAERPMDPKGAHRTTTSLPYLRLRDIRRVDPNLSPPPTLADYLQDSDVYAHDVALLLVRHGCILFASQFLRAVILPDMLLLLRRGGPGAEPLSEDDKAIYSKLQLRLTDSSTFASNIVVLIISVGVNKALVKTESTTTVDSNNPNILT